MDDYFKYLDEKHYTDPLEDLIIFDQQSICLDELITLLNNAAERVPKRAKIKFSINTETDKPCLTAKIKLGELS